MSAPVDVLAVMYNAAHAPEIREQVLDRVALLDARYAMAELIRAARSVESWITDYVPDDTCGRDVELRELSAAIARVQGGAA